MTTEKQRAQMRAHYWAHRQELLVWHRAYYKKNRARILEEHAANYAKKAVYKKAYQRAHYKRNRARILATAKAKRVQSGKKS